MSKGLSPIIATMLLIAITIAIGTIVTISLSSQATDYMNKEGDRRERILDREGESLTLVHVTLNGSGNPELTVQNNGTSDMEIAYAKINEGYHRRAELSCDFADCELNFDQSGTITVLTVVSSVEDIYYIEVGTTLGSLFVFTAPSPQIRITSTFFGDGNGLVTFSGEGSADDGQIVRYEWDFNNDGTYDDDGAVAMFNYSAGTYDVALRVTDDTGMISVTVLYNLVVP